MTKIRTQQELKARYPDYFRMLLGYWMSGSNSTEQLDRIVERMQKRAQVKQPQPKATTQPKPKDQPSQPEKQPSAPSKPPQKASRRRKKEMIPNQLVHARKFWENRRKAGEATGHYHRAIRKKTPMIFQRYGGRKLPCIISKDGGDKFTVLVDGKRQVIWKTSLQYAYRTRSQSEVEWAISIDEQVRNQNLEPILPRDGRYHIPDADLLTCQQEDRTLHLTMRGGEIIQGHIEWFGAFDIKINLQSNRSVVVFRHAVHDHKVLPKE